MNSKRIASLCAYGTALLILSIWLVASAALGQPVRAMNCTFSFSIPSQSLPSALLRYAEQSGVYVTSSASLIENERSRGIVGQFDARTALKKILEGTALGFETIDDRSVVILPVRATLNPRPDEKRAVSAEDRLGADQSNITLLHEVRRLH
jgi:hypothetical protein